MDGDGRDINLSFSPTAGEVRVAANVALRYSGLVWALVALMVFEFLVVGVWGHSVVWGVVFTVFFGLVEIAAWSWAIGARNRTLKQWTRIQLTTEELRITRAETDFHFKWSQFRKWVRREGVLRSPRQVTGACDVCGDTRPSLLIRRRTGSPGSHSGPQRSRNSIGHAPLCH